MDRKSLTTVECPRLSVSLYTQCMGTSSNDDSKFDAPQFPELFRNLLPHLKWLTSRKSLLQNVRPYLNMHDVAPAEYENQGDVKILGKYCNHKFRKVVYIMTIKKKTKSKTKNLHRQYISASSPNLDRQYPIF